MTDRHKHPPLYFRPAEDDLVWLLSVVRLTGARRNAVLSAALSEYRERHPHGPEMVTHGGIKITVDPRMPIGTAALVGPGYDGKPQVRVMTNLALAEPPPPRPPLMVDESIMTTIEKGAPKPKRPRRSASASPVADPSPKLRAAAKPACGRRLPKGAFCGECGRIHA